MNGEPAKQTDSVDSESAANVVVSRHSPLTNHPSPKWLLPTSAAVMALTMIPYLFGYSLTGASRPYGWFSWLGYNLDDSTVYLSWLRQAADGHFFQRNLFTTESQPTGQFNLFFLALGTIARITTLEPITIWHVSRLVLGIALLRATFALIERLAPDERSRRAAFLLVCFSAGFGWIPGLWTELGQTAPTDVWQPESITFFSLYLNPLFVVSLLLMVVFLLGLLDAERTESIKPAIVSGFCGLLLGNIHGYDVVTLAAIWGCYLAGKGILGGGIRASALARTAASFSPALITAGYQYYVLKTNPVFATRVSVPTLSPPVYLYLLGYGLLVPLALLGFRAMRHAGGRGLAAVGSPPLFLACWLIANLAAAYLPVPFQRKMIMGLHLPLCILAGAALAGWGTNMRSFRWRSALLAAVILTSLTNLRSLVRDMGFFQANLAQSVIQRPYLLPGERRALEWLQANVEPGTPIQPLPWIPRGGTGRFDTTMAAFTPGLTGLPVNAGHWGETPDFLNAIRKWGEFAAGMPLASAAELLRKTGVRYVIASQSLEPTREIPPHYVADTGAPLLRRIPEASNDDAGVFAVIDSNSNMRKQ